MESVECAGDCPELAHSASAVREVEKSAAEIVGVSSENRWGCSASAVAFERPEKHAIECH